MEKKSMWPFKAAYSRNVFSALLYGVCSTAMAFINKAVVSSYHFNYPFFIMTCQMAATIIAVETCRSLHYVQISKFTVSDGFSLFWPSAFSAAHSITSLYALKGMSIPMYAVIKRCTPIVTLVLSLIILRKSIPGCTVITSVVMITTGCVLAGAGDLQYDTGSYLYGISSVVVQGLYLTFIQRSSEEMSALRILYVNSYNILPVFFIACLFHDAGEITSFQGVKDVSFLLCFASQIFCGVLLNFSLFLCTAENSALTTSVLGVMKSILQTVIGSFTFGGIPFSALNAAGITLNTCGGILYVVSKFRKGRERTVSHSSELLPPTKMV